MVLVIVGKNSRTSLITEIIKNLRYTVLCAEDENEMYEKITNNHADIILMGGELGYKNEKGQPVFGASLVKGLRAAGYTIPICMIADEVPSNLDGHEAGAEVGFLDNFKNLHEGSNNFLNRVRELMERLDSLAIA